MFRAQKYHLLLAVFIHVAASSTDSALIADRYVSALFDLAREQNALDTTYNELAALAPLADEQPDFARLVEDPTIARDAKAKAVSAVLSQAKASTLTQRFVERLALNGRLSALPAIYRLFAEKLAEERNELHVQITAARELTAAQTQSLTDSLAASSGKTVVPTVTVDPTLIAGVIVRAGSKLLDYSLQGRLNQIALALQPNAYASR